MKQNRERGEKKLATRSISFILALVFVFSIFSGIASGAECKVVDETILDVVSHPKEGSIHCQHISSTCEQSTWKRTTTPKHDLETIYARTYACKCENTGKWETEPTPRIESKWEYNIPDDPVIDYLTGGATCPDPCVTQEQIDAATSDYVSWEYKVAGWETAVDFAKVALEIANIPLLKGLAKAAELKAKQSLDNAKSSRDAALEKLNELRKLPYCYPKPQRPGGCD